MGWRDKQPGSKSASMRGWFRKRYHSGAGPYRREGVENATRKQKGYTHRLLRRRQERRWRREEGL